VNILSDQVHNNRVPLMGKKEVVSIMVSRLEHQPFKNREHVIAEIRRCALAGSVSQYFSFLFAALGVIGEALGVTLGLQPMIWLLLAIFASVYAIIPHMHLVVAKHLLGTEAESKKNKVKMVVEALREET
jgi:hypothetical protein